MTINFKLEKRDDWSQARAGSFETVHGRVETPIFMPVATQAVLRGVDISVVDQLDYQVLLANTYHLLLRPGPELFEQVGGIHKFMRWPRAVLTDSGGFQIFSLSKSLVLTEEGARFRSYVDGSEVILTPELSINMQRAIGSDIMMVLDHCIDSTSDKATTMAALELTTRWAKRSFNARSKNSSQALFGIVQGACFTDLRRESATQITDIPFDGYAIGGLAVGETKAEREDMVEFTAPLLPSDKPRYLMGVGTPIDLLEAVKRGVDMFDCILPTNLAHQGVCFTSVGRIDLRRGVYRAAQEKLDPACQCSTCTRFSRAYLHHLKRTDEHVGHQLLSVHNLTFYRNLMRDMRASIVEGNFRKFYESNQPRLMATDAANPPKPPKRNIEREMTLGDYEVVVHVPDQHESSQYGSIRHKSSGEVMHSVSEPMSEARALYLAQSKLIDRITLPDAIVSQNVTPLIVWDVGLGAATNAMAAILAIEDLDTTLTRPVEIISFENDLDSLKLALKYPSLFPQVHHRAPHDILRTGCWKSEKHALTWRVINGDFHALLHEPKSSLASVSAPEIIWYDPFSYKVNGHLWSRATFELLLERCGHVPTALYTYTASTAVRAALFSAGWYVASGVGTGPKSETTIGLNRAIIQSESANFKLLSHDWLARWERSDAKQPLGTTGCEALTTVRNHPQFL